MIDCEGCIVDTLKEYGDDILKDIQTVIIEHDDFTNPNVEQNFVRPYLLQRFNSIVCRSDTILPACFYEVLTKKQGF